MTNRSPARILKPIIFYNDLFHYVEDNDSGETDQFALFNIYNSTVGFLNSKKKKKFSRVS